ncbi:MAG: hypothetical protein DMF61_27175 [Blastocatellia bacterium AA13]|nr:MAG: hypothetical protein DMF61_27175 [Blastocatellia bacterium AA13]
MRERKIAIIYVRVFIGLVLHKLRPATLASAVVGVLLVLFVIFCVVKLKSFDHVILIAKTKLYVPALPGQTHLKSNRM